MRKPVHRVSIIVVSLLLLMSIPSFLTYAGGNKVKELQKKLDACEAQSEQTQKENTELKSKLDLFTAQVSDFEAEIAALDERIAELEAQIAEKDAQIDALLSESGDVSVVSQQRLQMQDAEILELKQDRDALEDENRELRRELQQAKMDLADMESRAGYDVEEVEALTGEVNALTAENEELANQISELQDEKARLEAQVEELTMERDELEAALVVYEGIERDTKILMETAYQRIQEVLSDEIDAGTVGVFKGALGIVVDVHGEYMFDVGKVEINSTGKIILEKIVPIMAELEGYFIGVIGNADSKPIVTSALKKRFGTNWELSAHRGAVVVRYLIEKGNLPPAKMIAMGFGEYQPIEDNATVEGRGKNRRIDIILMPVDVFAAVVIGTQIR